MVGDADRQLEPARADDPLERLEARRDNTALPTTQLRLRESEALRELMLRQACSSSRRVDHICAGQLNAYAIETHTTAISSLQVGHGARGAARNAEVGVLRDISLARLD